MKTITICAEWVKEVRDGHCIPWGYDYKEYIYNDEYMEAYSLRIPQNTQRVKAIEMSNDSGIKDEYNRVYIDNSGKITKLFDVEPDPKDEQIKTLLLEIKTLKSENNELQRKLNAIRGILD